MAQETYILRHPLSSRLFHWGLILGFLPAAITGFIIWWKPPWDDVVHIAMRIHIIGAAIFTLSSILFLLFAFERVVLFIRHISEWSRDDLRWMLVCGGYLHKMLLKEEIEVPPVDKLGPGQKSMGALMLHGGIFLMASGWILYAFVPVVPRTISYWTAIGHEWVGLLLGAALLGHIVLAVYNRAEFKSMFGDGTIPLAIARKHSPLWVARHIEPVVKKDDAKTPAQAQSQRG